MEALLPLILAGLEKFRHQVLKLHNHTPYFEKSLKVLSLLFGLVGCGLSIYSIYEFAGKGAYQDLPIQEFYLCTGLENNYCSTSSSNCQETYRAAVKRHPEGAESVFFYIKVLFGIDVFALGVFLISQLVGLFCSKFLTPKIEIKLLYLDILLFGITIFLTVIIVFFGAGDTGELKIRQEVYYVDDSGRPYSSSNDYSKPNYGFICRSVISCELDFLDDSLISRVYTFDLDYVQPGGCLRSETTTTEVEGVLCTNLYADFWTPSTNTNKTVQIIDCNLLAEYVDQIEGDIAELKEAKTWILVAVSVLGLLVEILSTWIMCHDEGLNYSATGQKTAPVSRPDDNDYHFSSTGGIQ
eukprot:TRINITY_DN4215_c0_g1_i1.p1 TRINITY_DN4215_c0_g1~~TRINITY_DN4215_c0_g1_i1.p1  ORF type:complete len:354 (+),score=41.67 TRINITY_DN4215_c0_g1_i1:91-1152(+)